MSKLILNAAADVAIRSALALRSGPLLAPNTKLSDLSQSTVANRANDAADAVFEAGGSPRAQIDAARAASHKPLTYMPHDGNSAKARRRRQMERKAAKVSAE